MTDPTEERVAYKGVQNTSTKDRAVIDQVTKLTPDQQAALIAKLQERAARVSAAIAAIAAQHQTRK
jgi:hypothetical protein